MTAPFAGVITKRYADTGFDDPGRNLVEHAGDAACETVAKQPAAADPACSGVRCADGPRRAAVDVRVPTLDRSFPGRVARFAEKVSSATRTMDTEVDVPNPNLVLIPGMYAEANLTLDHRNGVLTVPIPAVDLGSDEASGKLWS